MLMVISPAKTLDYTSPITLEKHTQPQHIKYSQELIKQLKEYSVQDIASLMSISDKLAALNTARFAEWSSKFTMNNSRQAILAFKGDVYTGLNSDTFSEQDMEFAQQHLAILSGLYGLLRPLDLMQPYRLEMGTKLANKKGKDLYAFWGDNITLWLNDHLKQQKDNILLNLASNEYFKSVNSKQLEGQIINVDFKDLKNSQYKIISFYAKRARGMMTRYIIQNRLECVEQIKEFNAEGYYYCPKQSTISKFVFLRDEINT